MNPSRRGLLMSGRRSTQAAALTFGVLALGAVSAPAALAAQATGDEPATALPSADAGAPRILTDSPVLGLGTTDVPARFGTGKAQLAVAPEVAPADGEPAPDMSGAEIQFTYTSVFGNSLEGAGFPSAICTTDEAGSCSFDPSAPTTGGGVPTDGTSVLLLPGSTFTIEQITPPTSGDFALPAGSDAVVHGTTVGDPDQDMDLDQDVELDLTELEALPADEAFDMAVEEVQDTAAEDSTPEPLRLAPTVGTDEEGLTTITFLDPVVTLAPAAPTTSPDGTGTAAAATTTTAAASGTGTPGTSTGTAAGAQLATTGTDTLPMLATGAALLLAGTGAVVLGRRRTRSS